MRRSPLTENRRDIGRVLLAVLVIVLVPVLLMAPHLFAWRQPAMPFLISLVLWLLFVGGGGIVVAVMHRKRVASQRLAERVFRENLEWERLLSEVSRGLISASMEETKVLIESALGRLGAFQGADRCRIFVFSPDDSLLVNTHSWQAEGVGLVVSAEEMASSSIPWLSARCRAGEIVRIGDVADLPNKEKVLFQRQGIQSSVAIPLFQGPLVRGFLQIDAIGQAVEWDEESVSRMRVLGEILNHSIARSYLDRMVLNQSQIVDEIHEAVLVADAKGIIGQWYKGAERMLGYSGGEVVGKPIGTLLADEGSLSEDLQEQLGRDGFAEMEIRMRRKDGGVFPASLSLSRHHASMPPGVIACVTDLSERKRAEEALRQTNERYELAMRATNDAIWDWDLVNDTIYRSPKFAELIGYELSEADSLVGALRDQTHPDDRQRVEEALRDHIFNHTPHLVEYRRMVKGGAYRWFRSHAQAIWDETGRAIRVVGAMSDIHESKQVELALRLSNERYETILRATNDAIWDWDLEKGTWYRSPRHVDLLGYDLDDMDDPPGTWEERTHPEDRARVKEALGTCLYGGGGLSSRSIG